MRAAIATIATLVALTAAAAAQPAAKPSAEHGTIERRLLDPREDPSALLEEYSPPPIDDSTGRLVVSHVAPRSTSSDLGLRTGDIIVAIDGYQVFSRAGLELRAATLADKDVVYIEIIRKRKPRLLRREVRGPFMAEALMMRVATPAQAAEAAPTAAELDRLVVQQGKNTWAVDVDAILADPARFARQARIVPSVEDGQPNGFKLYVIDPSSVYTRLGLENDDTITAIGGHRLTTRDVFEIYTEVRNATGKVEVHITRRGTPMLHTYVRKPPATPRP